VVEALIQLRSVRVCRVSGKVLRQYSCKQACKVLEQITVVDFYNLAVWSCHEQRFIIQGEFRLCVVNGILARDFDENFQLGEVLGRCKSRICEEEIVATVNRALNGYRFIGRLVIIPFNRDTKEGMSLRCLFRTTLRLERTSLRIRKPRSFIHRKEC
jgi:hypothetical protein